MSSWAERNFVAEDNIHESSIIGFENVMAISSLEAPVINASVPTLRREDASLSISSFSQEMQHHNNVVRNYGRMMSEQDFLASGSSANGSASMARSRISGNDVLVGSARVQLDEEPTVALQPPIIDLTDSLPNTPEFGPQDRLSFDVGLESLDDILGCEEAHQYINSPRVGPQSPFVRPQSSSSIQDVPSWSLQEQSVNNGQASFRDTSTAVAYQTPPPKTFQTGFDVSKSVRGGLYDYMNPSTTRSGYNTPVGNPRWIGPPTRPQDPFNFPSRRNGHSSASSHSDKAVLALKYKPSERETNYYRTVNFSELAPSIHLRDVLARVRGGAVKHAVMTDTTAITGSKTAVVQFVMEDAAFSYVIYTGRYPIVFRDEKTSAVTCTPSISRINTPTYLPATKYVLKDLEGYNQTRCISVEEFPDHIDAAKVANDFTVRFQFRIDTLLELFFDDDGILHMEFSSIEAAAFAYVAISNWSREMRVRFESDPCSRPLEDLRDPIEKRPSTAIDDHEWSAKSPEEQAKALEDNSDKFKMLLYWITSHRGRQPTPVVERKPASRLIPSEAKPVPCMDGFGLQGTSWADEVINEMGVDYGTVDRLTAFAGEAGLCNTSIADGEEHSDDLKAEKFNQNISTENMTNSPARKPPSGLAASIYASDNPAFRNVSASRRKGRHMWQRRESARGTDPGRFNETVTERQNREQAPESSNQMGHVASYIKQFSSGEIMQSIERDDDQREFMDGEHPAIEQISGMDRDDQSFGSGDRDFPTEDDYDVATPTQDSNSSPHSPDLNSASQTNLALINGLPPSPSSSKANTISSSSNSNGADNHTLTMYPTVFKSRLNTNSITNLLLFNATGEHLARHFPANPLIPISFLSLPLRKILAKRQEERALIPNRNAPNASTHINIIDLPNLDQRGARSHIAWSCRGGEIRADIVKYFSGGMERVTVEEIGVARRFLEIVEMGFDTGVLLKDGVWGDSDEETGELN